MMDRGFASMENITYMLKKSYLFLQAIRVNANWIREIIDDGRRTRLRPDAMRKADDRTYYVSTSPMPMGNDSKNEQKRYPCGRNYCLYMQRSEG